MQQAEQKLREGKSEEEQAGQKLDQVIVVTVLHKSEEEQAGQKLDQVIVVTVSLGRARVGKSRLVRSLTRSLLLLCCTADFFFF